MAFTQMPKVVTAVALLLPFIALAYGNALCDTPQHILCEEPEIAARCGIFLGKCQMIRDKFNKENMTISIPEEPENQINASLRDLDHEFKTTPIPEDPEGEIETKPIPEDLEGEFETTHIPEDLEGEFETKPIPEDLEGEFETKPIPEDPEGEIEMNAIPEEPESQINAWIRNLDHEFKTIPIPEDPEGEFETTPIPEDREGEFETTPIPEDPEGEIKTKHIPEDPEGEIETKPIPEDPEGEIETKPIPEDPEGEIETKPIPEDPEGEIETKPIPEDPEGEIETKPIPENLPGDFGNKAPLVQFDFYYESMCPFCQLFFKIQLGPNYDKISSIVNMTLVPYGNAKEEKHGDHYEFTCQHGGHECIGNLIETCTINIVKNTSKYLPFLVCLETSISEYDGYRDDPSIPARACAKKNPVPIDDILECSTNNKGNELEHEMALKTEALDPHHKYVPWFVLNGVHNENIQDNLQNNFLEFICKTYTGTKPPGCHLFFDQLFPF